MQNEFSPSNMPANRAAPAESENPIQTQTPQYSDNFHDLTSSDMRS